MKQSKNLKENINVLLYFKLKLKKLIETRFGNIKANYFNLNNKLNSYSNDINNLVSRVLKV